MSDVPDRSGTCAIVVTYNPAAGLADRLSRVLPQVEHLVVVDNASSKPVAAELHALGSQVTLIQNDANLGVGAALNQGVEAAAARGARWALLLDDDSLVEGHLLDRYAALLAGFPERDRVGIVGCNFWDANRQQPGFDPLTFRHRLGSFPVVMTSGSALRVSAFRAVGPFRGDFFIDCIDFEYSLRLEAAGWLSMVTNEVLMDHSLGAPVTHRFPRRLCNHHSVARTYYWVRNRSVMVREHRGRLADRVRFVRGGVGKVLRHIVLHDRQKARRLLAVGLALWHARRGRLGPAPAVLQGVRAGER